MGIQAFFLVLAGFLGLGSVSALALVLLRRLKAARLVFIGTLLVGGAWYTLPAIDVVSNLLFFPDDTIYAKGYSEGSFRGLETGQTSKDVAAAVGEPLERRLAAGDALEYWYYSKHGRRYESYWNKILIFDASTHLLVKKISEFYSD